MLYYISPIYKPEQLSQIETWDGKVVRTTPFLAWMRDMDIAEVTSFCETHGYSWRIVSENLRSTMLSDHHYKNERPGQIVTSV